jgi:pimeloyl-ACP methyl ester carboxylesterase
MDSEVRFTPSGVRLRLRARRPGDMNWLLLPGGPGIGSESLEDLADTLEVPGAIWLVDLPGDGSNRAPPGAPADPFSVWPQVVAEAARALPNVVFAGHSTGGMYLLATPELAPHLRGLALLDSAPDASWHARFVAMTRAHPLPEVDAAAAAYAADKRDALLTGVVLASAPWNFTDEGMAAGRKLLGRMPYNGAAVDWSDAHFDHQYVAAWWPEEIPVLILGGAADRIVWQGAWDAPQFSGPNVLRRTIPGGGHFPWIENPRAVAAAFDDLATRVIAGLR